MPETKSVPADEVQEKLKEDKAKLVAFFKAEMFPSHLHVPYLEEVIDRVAQVWPYPLDNLKRCHPRDETLKLFPKVFAISNKEDKSESIEPGDKQYNKLLLMRGLQEEAPVSLEIFIVVVLDIGLKRWFDKTKEPTPAAAIDFLFSQPRLGFTVDQRLVDVIHEHSLLPLQVSKIIAEYRGPDHPCTTFFYQRRKRIELSLENGRKSLLEAKDNKEKAATLVEPVLTLVLGQCRLINGVRQVMRINLMLSVCPQEKCYDSHRLLLGLDKEGNVCFRVGDETYKDLSFLDKLVPEMAKELLSSLGKVSYPMETRLTFINARRENPMLTQENLEKGSYKPAIEDPDLSVVYKGHYKSNP